MSVCFFPINVKTVEPIGSKFCVGPNMTPGKLCGSSKFQKQVSNKIRFLSNLKIHEFYFIKSANFSLLYYNVYIEKMFTIENETWAQIGLKA